jgi:hypothetical protein
MAKKKAVPKNKKKTTKKGKKKAAAPRKAVRRRKTAPKRGPSRGKKPGTGVLLEVAEVEVVGEPEDIANDEVFPPDYGGSE